MNNNSLISSQNSYTVPAKNTYLLDLMTGKEGLKTPNLR